MNNEDTKPQEGDGPSLELQQRDHGSADPRREASGTQGEDDQSSEREGDDRHLHDDQKSKPMPTGDDGDDDTKTQDLAKAGRTGFDPNEGQE